MYAAAPSRMNTARKMGTANDFTVFSDRNGSSPPLEGSDWIDFFGSCAIIFPVISYTFPWTGIAHDEYLSEQENGV